MPIVKSNAYGHGAQEVCRTIQSQVLSLGVVSSGEALALRRSGYKKNIVVLGYVERGLLLEALRNNIELPVYSVAYAQRISTAAKKIRKIARVHLKIDTGTSRIGVRPETATAVVGQINALPNVVLVGVWSHFASAQSDQKFTAIQRERFIKATRGLPTKVKRHMACTAAIVGDRANHFDAVRLGLGLYGLWPSSAIQAVAAKKHPLLKLKPALTWKTSVIQVKSLLKGESVSYDKTFTAKKDMLLAVLAVGYWEGLDRRLSNVGVVLIRGKRCKILGRICMNLTMVDVTNLPSVKAGDEVILIGTQGREQITAEQFARWADTINYEVVTRINPMLERHLVQ